MDYKTAIGAAGAVVAVIQYSIYIRSVLQGETKPHIFSWFVWGVPCGVVFLAQILKDAGAGSWATGATAILCTVIFLLSLRYGDKEITKIDLVSFVLSLLAIILWIITNDPLWSVILITAADVLGMIPTLRKSYLKPHEEILQAWVIANIKWILAFFALQTLTLTTYLYPVAMFASITALIVLLLWRRGVKARA